MTAVSPHYLPYDTQAASSNIIEHKGKYLFSTLGNVRYATINAGPP